MELQDESIKLTAEETQISFRVTCAACGLTVPPGTLVCPNDGSRLTTVFEAGAQIAGKYTFTELIGKGGMSAVYRGVDNALGRTVAIKLLHAHLAQEPTLLHRFRQEARAVSQMDHANVVRVYDFGVLEHGQPYIVMDYLEGESLHSRLRTGGTLSNDEAFRILCQLAGALAHAHARGILHRDLKPSNVMLANDEHGSLRAVLVDFGIAKLAVDADAAKLTATGEVLGSPIYMSPEQARGMPVDERSDLYSLGCLMYEALSGQPVVTGENPLEVLYKKTHGATRSLREVSTAASSGLVAIVDRLLQSEPHHRYQTAKDLLADLSDPAGLSKRVVRQHRHSIRIAANNKAIIGALAMICIGVGCQLWLSQRAPHESPAVPPLMVQAVPGTTSASTTDAGLARNWKHYTARRELSYPKSDITNAGLVWFTKLPLVEKIDLSDDSQITDEAAQSLVKLPHLRTLNVDRTSVTDKFLFSMPNDTVQWLSINGTKISNIGIRHIVNQWQHLRGISFGDSAATPETVDILSRVPELSQLYLNRASVTDRSVRKVGEFAHLQTLGLDLGSLTADSVRHLQSLHLNTLQLNYDQLDDSVVSVVTAMPGLESLSLAGNNITDSSMPALAKATQLRELNLNNTRVTGQGLLKLAPLKNLRTIHINGLVVSRDDLRSLMRQHPGCLIVSREDY